MALRHDKDSKLCVDKTEKILYRDGNPSSGEQIQEREANAFVAATLMPQKLIIQRLEKHKNETNIDFSFKYSEVNAQL